MEFNLEYYVANSSKEQRLHELQARQNLQQESDQQTEKHISQLRCYAEQMELTEVKL